MPRALRDAFCLWCRRLAALRRHTSPRFLGRVAPVRAGQARTDVRVDVCCNRPTALLFYTGGLQFPCGVLGALLRRKRVLGLPDFMRQHCLPSDRSFSQSSGRAREVFVSGLSPLPLGGFCPAVWNGRAACAHSRGLRQSPGSVSRPKFLKVSPVAHAPGRGVFSNR